MSACSARFSGTFSDAVTCWVKIVLGSEGGLAGTISLDFNDSTVSTGFVRLFIDVFWGGVWLIGCEGFCTGCLAVFFGGRCSIGFGLAVDVGRVFGESGS